MKYFSSVASVYRVKTVEGHWASLRRAKFLSDRICYVLAFSEWSAPRPTIVTDSDETIHYATIKEAITEYLYGTRSGDLWLRANTSLNEYRRISEVADFITEDSTSGIMSGFDEKSKAAYVLSDLNSGRTIVLLKRG